MCLATVKRVTKIKKPLRVYKVIKRSLGGDVNFEATITNHPIHSRLNVDNKNGPLTVDSPISRQEYETGFHLFTNKRTAIEDADAYYEEVVAGIIPAGTTVTFGTGLGEYMKNGEFVESRVCQQVVAKRVIYETHTLSGKEV